RTLDRPGVEQLWAQSIEDRMALLVADDILALARIDRPPACRAVEEVECPPVVIGVEVFALVEQQVERVAHLPGRVGRQQLAPEGRAPRRRLGRRPIAKLRRTGRVAARRRRGYTG